MEKITAQKHIRLKPRFADLQADLRSAARSPARRHRILRVAPSSAPLAKYRAIAPAAAPDASVSWWRSSRNLDLCLLAVCSCLLSLLCHQALGALTLPSASASSLSPSRNTTLAQMDFLIKAGLVSSSRDRQTVQGDKS